MAEVVRNTEKKKKKKRKKEKSKRAGESVIKEMNG